MDLSVRISAHRLVLAAEVLIVHHRHAGKQ